MPGGFNHYEQSLRIVDVLENDGRGLNLTWEVRDGIAKHSKGKSGAPVGMAPALRASTIEGQIMRVADLIAYVNHDIDDATRAGLLEPRTCRASRSSVLGATVVGAHRHAGEGRRHRDARRRADRDPHERRRCSTRSLDLRSFLFDAVYENDDRDGGVQEGGGHPRAGCGRRSASAPTSSSTARTIETEGLDAAARDFIAGMTDRYAVRLFEQLFIPKPWARSN